MAAIGANPLFIVGGVSVLTALVASLIVQFVILKQGRKLGGRCLPHLVWEELRQITKRVNIEDLSLLYGLRPV